MLNLDVTVMNLNLRTLNSSVSKAVDSVNVTIESFDCNFSIDMRSIYIVDSIPTKSYTVDVNAYSHLRDVDFVSTFDHEVDLLIGQDYASCFVPLEVRKGLKNEPYAQDPGSFTVGDMYRKRWRHTQHIIDSFWKKWINCYLRDLQKRVKWQNAGRNLAIGDLVLVLDESAPRGLWPLALVKNVFTSTDGLVRSVRVKTSSSEYVRPITKLVMLEGQEMFE